MLPFCPRQHKRLMLSPKQNTGQVEPCRLGFGAQLGALGLGRGWDRDGECYSRVRAMPYLYKVVLGVTGAEGSSEEEVEPLGSLPSPEELVVLLRVHVELPLGIAPGILQEEEHPPKPGGSAGPEEPTAVTSSGTASREVLLLFTPRLVHPPCPGGGGRLCFGYPRVPLQQPTGTAVPARSLPRSQPDL